MDELVSRAYGAHPLGLVGLQYHAHPALPGVPVISPVFRLRVSLCGCVAPRRRAPDTNRCGRCAVGGDGRPWGVERPAAVGLVGKVNTAVANAGRKGGGSPSLYVRRPPRHQRVMPL